MHCQGHPGQDGELYRARVVSVDSKATSESRTWRDQGEDLYELLAGLELKVQKCIPWIGSCTALHADP